MIDRLKRNFIITNMLIILIVIVTMFSYLYLSSAKAMEDESYQLPEMARARVDLEFDKARKRGYPIFNVTVDNEGAIVDVNGDLFVDDLELSKIVSLMISEKGKVSEYHIRYTSQEIDLNTSYLVTDIKQEHDLLLRLLINLISIGAVVLVAFIFISFKLSKMIVKPAEIAWENQKQFISDASHELKTPLTVILANSELLYETKLEGEINRNRINYVQQEAYRMKQLVEEMLFLAKFDESSREKNKDFHNISEIILESVLMFEPIAYESQIEMLSDVEENLMIECIPEQIKQLNHIFIDNAIKYTPSGESVEITLKKIKNQIVYRINNGGTFLEADELDKIFNRFYKTDKVRNSTKNSFGLGLSIAKKIIEFHYASINVISTKEDGTTFEVHFPIK